MNLVNYFCLGERRKWLEKEASNAIVPGRKKGMIKTCLKEFGSETGSRFPKQRPLGACSGGFRGLKAGDVTGLWLD